MLTSGVYPVTVHDFRVNPATGGAVPHYDGNISFTQEGDFIIVWIDRGIDHNNRQIYFQRFDTPANAVGDPVLVSDTAVHLNNSVDIATGPSGRFAICWSTTTKIGQERLRDIWVQAFDSQGQPLWPRQQVDVDRVGTDYKDTHPSIAMDEKGNFVVVWQTSDSGGRNVYAQRFETSGERIGGNFLVSDLKASNYTLCNWFTQFPDVAINSKGYFFICWQGCVQCRPASPDIPLARVYHPSGDPVTTVFPFFAPCFSKWTCGNFPSVAPTSQNTFVVAFNATDTVPTYPNNAVVVQSFDTLGNAVDSARIVSDSKDLGEVWFYPRVAVDSADGCVVLWSDRRTVTSRNLWAQRFNSLGKPVGKNYRINIPPGSLVSPDDRYGDWSMHQIAIWNNTVGISWVDYRNWEVYDADIYAKLLDLDAIGHYLPGDVVLDGIVDTADVRYLVNYLFMDGWGLLPDWTGDVNASGEVTISDVVYLVNYVLKRGPPPQKPRAGSE